jgi:D-glycero-alpha-D-manno-heptose-7-phosphate kinase
MIITRTPYRLSLFGGGTDYPEWFSSRPCRLVAAAMQHYCYITVRHLPPFFSHHSRIVYSRIEDVADNSHIQHPGVVACLGHLCIDDGLEIHHDGDLPARSGIGSSSAFTVGLLLALYTLHEKAVSPQQLAAEAIHVEQNILQEAVGIQDQVTAAFGGMRVLDMGPDREWISRPLAVSQAYRRHFEDHVLLGFSGISRTADQFAREKVENIRLRKTEVELREIAQMAEDAIDLLQCGKDLDAIGALLHRSWIAKTKLNAALGESHYQQIIDVGLRNGAWGGKLMGAGGGGFFYFLAPPESHNDIRHALHQIKVWVPFRLDRGGSQVIFQTDY